MTILGVSNSFTGPANVLELVGDHAYLFTGEVNSTQPANTVIEFTSGNYYFVGTFNVLTIDTSGDDMVMELQFNGATVLSQNYPSQFYRAVDASVGIIIPAYTEVKMTLYNPTAATNRVYTIGITGRIYR
jgi:hypothetical protein